MSRGSKTRRKHLSAAARARSGRSNHGRNQALLNPTVVVVDSSDDGVEILDDGVEILDDGVEILDDEVCTQIHLSQACSRDSSTSI